VQLTSLTPVVVTVPRGEAGQLKTQLTRTDPLLAPLAAGQKLGTLKVMSGRQVVAEVPVTVAEAVPMAGLFGRMWDGLRLMIK
jgi:D-alanyl-D-alanine carboxypeptidase (penicillin-binding protein 5/6)